MVNLITLGHRERRPHTSPPPPRFPIFFRLDAACQFFSRLRNIHPIHLSSTRQGTHVYHAKAEKTLAALSASSSR